MNTTISICTHQGLYQQDNIASLGLLVYCVSEHVYNQGFIVTGIEIIVGMIAYMIFTCVGYASFLIILQIIDFDRPYPIIYKPF